MSAIWDVRYWKGFAVITIKKNFLTYTEQQNGPVQLTVKFYTPLVTVDLSPFFLNFKVFSFIMIDFLLQVTLIPHLKSFTSFFKLLTFA